MTGKSQWGTIAAPGGGIMGCTASRPAPDQIRELRCSRIKALREAALFGLKFLYEPPASTLLIKAKATELVESQENGNETVISLLIRRRD